MTMTPERAVEFRDGVINKVETLLDEFAGGTISRAHFDVVYQRYSRQLHIAEQAIDSGDFSEFNRVINDTPTVILHQTVRGTAIGMSIIHHIDMHTIRQFGQAEIEAPVLDGIMANLKDSQKDELTNFSEIQRVSGNKWIVVCSLDHTSLLTIFDNEPAAKQVQELERRHHDFESANRNSLNQLKPDPETLVYPVELFIQTS